MAATKKSGSKRALGAKETDTLLEVLCARFKKYPSRHPGVKWEKVEERLRSNPGKLWSLNEMERTGGEPDVVAEEGKSSELVFIDCALESPTGRRSLCFDEAALKSRKENKPKGSAEALADDMGIEILNEEQYRRLQLHGPFDAKTSSWILTPDSIRRLGGALFCDYRYGTVFTYHNGAESYYAARGFRGFIRV